MIRIIECDTVAEADLYILNAKKRQAVDRINIDFPEPPEVNGKVFEKMMLAKGYKVSSVESKAIRCAQFKIKRTKRGKEWWYLTSDIQKVPAKR